VCRFAGCVEQLTVFNLSEAPQLMVDHAMIELELSAAFELQANSVFPANHGLPVIDEVVTRSTSSALYGNVIRDNHCLIVSSKTCFRMWFSTRESGKRDAAACATRDRSLSFGERGCRSTMCADAESEDGINWDLGETPRFLADGVSPPSLLVWLLPFVAS
jgi:hypothetical protein